MNVYSKEWQSANHPDLYVEFRKHKPFSEIPIIVAGILKEGLREIRVLDVGGGSGISSLPIIDQLLEYGVDVASWDVIDYSQAQLQIFQERAGQRIRPIFSFILADWNQFSPSNEYDFVLALHSWYGMRGWQQVTSENPLYKFQRSLKEIGVGLIVVTAQGNVLSTISNNLRGEDVRMSGEEIFQELAGLGVDYMRESYQLPLPALLENGVLTIAGRALYRYLANMPDLSPVQGELERKLAEWFSEHGSWFSAVDFIWLRKA